MKRSLSFRCAIVTLINFSLYLNARCAELNASFEIYVKMASEWHISFLASIEFLYVLMKVIYSKYGIMFL